MKRNVHIGIIALFLCQICNADFIPFFIGPAGGLLGVDAIISTEVPPSTQTAVQRNKNLGLREFVVYLPPGYFNNNQQIFDNRVAIQALQGCGRVIEKLQCFDQDDQFCARMIQPEFPIAYFLEGDDATHLFNLNQFFVDKMDLLISSGTIIPMVLVALASDTTNPWGPCGAFETDPPNQAPFVNGKYVNSSLTGFFESYITRELYHYMQEHYRVFHDRRFTGIFGYSQGGYGAMLYGAKHADLYGLVGVGAGLIDYIHRFIPGFASFFTLQKSMNIIHDFTPNTSPEVLDVFADSAARSPQFQLYAPENPGYKYGVALPFDADRNIFLNAVQAWQIDALDTVIEQHAEELQTVKTLIFNGVIDTNVEYVGARALFDLMITLSLNPVFITHEGDHFTLPYQTGLPLFPFDSLIQLLITQRIPIENYLNPTLQFFSAAMLEDDTIAARRSRIIGVGTIELQNNAVMSIGGDAIVGVETDFNGTITVTDIKLQIRDSAQFDIGQSTGPGGAFQIGNPLTAQDLIDMPILQTDVINFTLDLDGPNAQMIIGPRGFLGLAAGLQGKGLLTEAGVAQNDINLSTQRALRPSNWVITSLQNVANISLLITQGAWRHQQIASSNQITASLMVLGDAQNYVFQTSGQASIYGGGNMIKLIDALGINADVTNTVESPFAFGTDSLLLYPFGVTDIDTPRSTFFPDEPTDPFGNGFPFPIVSRNASAMGFQRQLLTSTPILLDPNLQTIEINGTVDGLFDILGVTNYQDQINYKCTAAYDGQTGDIVIGYINESNTLTDFLFSQTLFLHEINRNNPELLQVPDCLANIVHKEIEASVENHGVLTLRIDDQGSNELLYNGAVLDI